MAHAPKPLNPAADPVPSTDWLAEDNTQTSLYPRLGSPTGVADDSSYIWTRYFDNPTVGPTVVTLLDDTARVNMFGNVVDTGHLAPARSFRVGQRTCEDVFTDLVDVGTDFRAHVGTFGPCWPMRMEVLTCNYRKNHHMRTNSGAAYDAVMTNPAGEYFQLPGRPSQETAGPWGLTLAGTLPPQKVPVTNPAHAALLRVGRPDDDVQARTGNWIIELARAGVDPWGGGKLSNPWDETRPIPAGITHSRFQVVDSGSQWSSQFVDYDGPNAWDGPGHVVGSTSSHDYSRGSGTVSWTSANGGRLLVSGVTHRFVDPATLDYQQECTLDSGAHPTFNGTYFVAAVTDATHCELTCPVDPGASGSCNIFNREEYPIFRLVNEAIAYLKACKAAGKAAFIYMAPHITHDTGLGGDSYGNSYEKCYEGAVATPAGNGLWFDGVETQLSGTANNPPSSTTLTTFKADAQMMASFNDAFRRLNAALKALHGDNFHFFLTSDQGDQIGDQSSRGNGSIKTSLWQSSASPFMYVKGPFFQKGAKVFRPTCHADIGLTVLDIYARQGLTGLGDNHMHDDRDGASWLGFGARKSILDPAHPAYNRVIPIYGDWKTQFGEAYIDPNTLQKFVRVEAVTTAAKSYDIRLPSEGGDYETAEGALSTLTTPTLAHFNSVFGLIDDARWDPTTNTNACHDGSILV